ncbi:hypothetical protein [Lacticaseibacillus absianus]|uniref:hypothetical protein n=1 Tax=Lacticaseibacillus absianus TaxID=2729623 RepID=UPI0015CB705F|nr:hypothetical protein [Lacticaseibacillus absianus]
MMHPLQTLFEKADSYMSRHPKVSEFFDWEGQPVNPDNDPSEAPGYWDDKKAPAAATAETSALNKKIIYLSLARQQPMRKVVK